MDADESTAAEASVESDSNEDELWDESLPRSSSPRRASRPSLPTLNLKLAEAHQELALQAVEAMYQEKMAPSPPVICIPKLFPKLCQMAEDEIAVVSKESTCDSISNLHRRDDFLPEEGGSMVVDLDIACANISLFCGGAPRKPTDLFIPMVAAKAFDAPNWDSMCGPRESASVSKLALDVAAVPCDIALDVACPTRPAAALAALTQAMPQLAPRLDRPDVPKLDLQCAFFHQRQALAAVERQVQEKKAMVKPSSEKTPAVQVMTPATQPAVQVLPELSLHHAINQDGA